MALSAEEFNKLQGDFASGRNPLAYLPLVSELRRQRRYQEGLEICQRGLAGDPNSVAGRTLLARILADLGRYPQALHEVQRVEASAPDSLGLKIEKARCLIKLRMVDEARATMDWLNTVSPMDPQVQVLNPQLRQLEASTSGPARASSPRIAMLATSVEDMAKSVRTGISPVARLLALGVYDLDSGKSAVEGSDLVCGAGEALYQEVALACDELDRGEVRFLVAETSKCLSLTLRRGRRLVVVGVDPSTNYGKLHHRLNAALAPYSGDAK
jgi:tetratricopeptide (TPR) repeat protein